MIGSSWTPLRPTRQADPCSSASRVDDAETCRLTGGKTRNRKWRSAAFFTDLATDTGSIGGTFRASPTSYFLHGAKWWKFEGVSGTDTDVFHWANFRNPGRTIGPQRLRETRSVTREMSPRCYRLVGRSSRSGNAGCARNPIRSPMNLCGSWDHPAQPVAALPLAKGSSAIRRGLAAQCPLVIRRGRSPRSPSKERHPSSTLS
jgi:hypothetical protein